MKHQHNPELEYRYQSPPQLVTDNDAQGNESRLVRGTAVFFNQLSNRLHEYSDGKVRKFREKFHPSAFDKVLQTDIVAYFNHNRDLILARTSSNTLKVWTDEVGLHYEFEAPQTTAGNDLIVSMRRGDVSHSSFSFGINTDKWERGEDNEDIRTVIEVNLLDDVSPVVRPAYPQTLSQLAARSYDQFITQNTYDPDKDPALITEIELLEAELALRQLYLR